jgi:hypothetical protein
MKKAYVLGPVLGLLVFTAFYWNFSRGAVERQHQVELRQQEERRTRILKEAESRKRAIEDAIAAQQKRAAERAAKEKRTEERRNQAYEEVNKRLKPQLDRLKSDADEIKAAIAQLELQKRQYIDEEAFLRTYVRKAQENVKTYYAILDRIAAAEKARAEAEAAARVAKKD